MTRIDPNSPLHALLGAVERSAPGSRTPRSSRQEAGPGGSKAAHRGSLRERLAALAAGVDPDDAAAMTRVAPALLREVLAHEIGADVLDLAESPHLLRQLERELSRSRYSELWRDLILSLRLPTR